MSFKRPFLLAPVTGGMPLHDAVGINCKKRATTENHGASVKYMGCMLDD